MHLFASLKNALAFLASPRFLFLVLVYTIGLPFAALMDIRDWGYKLMTSFAKVDDPPTCETMETGA